jgi:hypothetical protein
MTIDSHAACRPQPYHERHESKGLTHGGSPVDMLAIVLGLDYFDFHDDVRFSLPRSLRGLLL